MTNQIHLIGNAHLDPIWLWRWREGCGEVLQTFRAAIDRLKEFDDFIFTVPPPPITNGWSRLIRSSLRRSAI